MHKTVAFLIATTLTLTFATAAEATIYEGGGAGIKVELHAKGRQIVFAKVRVTLHCLDEGRRRLRRFGVAWNTDRSFPAVREYHSRPINLSEDGRFFESSSDDAEAGYSAEELFAGQVRYWLAAGRFHYANEYRTPARSERCRTGSYPGTHKSALVHFRAPRL
jgi:hypothetical protein